jgi:hypothetical protein
VPDPIEDLTAAQNAYATALAAAAEDLVFTAWALNAAAPGGWPTDPRVDDALSGIAAARTEWLAAHERYRTAGALDRLNDPARR